MKLIQALTFDSKQIKKSFGFENIISVYSSISNESSCAFRQYTRMKYDFFDTSRTKHVTPVSLLIQDE